MIELIKSFMIPIPTHAYRSESGLSLSLHERMDFPSNNNRGPHVIGVARTEPASEVSDRPWFTTVAQLFTYLYIHTHSLIYTRAAPLAYTAVCVFKWPVAPPQWLCSSLALVGKRSRTRIWQRTHFFWQSVHAN